MSAAIVVVGLGPAGVVAAKVLSDAGHRVTALQPTSTTSGRAPFASPVPTVRRSPHEQARPALVAQDGADRLGGSKHLAAPQSYRLDPWSFRIRSATVDRYGAQAIPTDADPIDWPMGLDELTPYYERVERIMRVAPRPASGWTERMADAAHRVGRHSFDAPAAASRDVSPILSKAPVRIVEGTAVSISMTSGSAVRSVEYLTDHGESVSILCDAVVIAAAVLPTVRLLLLSGIEAGGQVGRFFMAHSAFVVNGWFPRIDLGRDSAGPATAVAITTFEADEFDHAALGFLGGSILQAAMTGPRTPQWVANVARAPDAAPGTFDDRKAWVAQNGASIGTVWAQPDQLPRAANRLDLDPGARDPSGRPVMRVTFDVSDDDLRRAAFLGGAMAEWLRAAGAQRTWMSAFDAQPLGTHLYGGARMSDDPSAGVVDRYGRVHGTQGLVVVGASTFPSTGGRGPVETVEALAWRSAERLLRDLL